MPDHKFEALIQQLEGTRILLKKKAADPSKVDADMNQMIAKLREERQQAIADKTEAAFYSKVEGLAKGLEGMGAASMALVNAVQSGDPFAISASTLDLATSVISAASVFGGPIGAAAGAVLGAVLSIVSMILKAFQKESESLLSQIATLIRDLENEKQLDKLSAAAGHIRAFTTSAISSNKVFTFANITTMHGHGALDLLTEASAWLGNSKNQELSHWGDALALFCQGYTSFKLAIAYWLPVIKPDNDDNPTEKLITWGNAYDGGVLDFLERIKPAARNRGILLRSDGANTINVRDVVISNKAKWTDLTGHAWAVSAAYRRGRADSPNPFLSFLHLGGPEPSLVYPFPWFTPNQFSGYIPPFDRDSRHWDYDKFRHEKSKETQLDTEFAILGAFTKKSKAYDMDGQWPLKDKWRSLEEIEKEGAYDICAIPGSGPGQINIYTTTGQTIRCHIEHKNPGGDHLTLEWEQRLGHSIVSIRAARPRTFPGEDPKALTNVDWIVYGLSNSGDGSRPFRVLALFPAGRISLFPPQIFDDPKDWRNALVGIAADSSRLWMFGTSFIACVTHTAVKLLQEKQRKDWESVSPDWTTYRIPPDVLGYDPGRRVYMGLCDLSACDDGTLTAVFEDKNGDRRIFAAETQFEPGKPIIRTGYAQEPPYGDPTTTHGWLKDPDPDTRARRVHKLPIFCWSALEALEEALKSGSFAGAAGSLSIR